MALLQVIAHRPMPRWQALCIRDLATSSDTIIRVVTLPAERNGTLWSAVIKRCSMLSAENGTGADGENNTAGSPLPELVIDLTGSWKAGPEIRCWRITQGDGTPLAAAFPFASSWSRPGAIGTVFVQEDGGPIIGAAHFAVSNGRHYVRILEKLLNCAARLPAAAWRSRSVGRALDSTSAPATGTPTNHPVFHLAAGAMRYLWRRVIEMSAVELWQVGLVERPIYSFLKEPSPVPVTWLSKLERHAYCADPFANPDDPAEIWWERFDYHGGKGTIERMRLNENLRPEAVPLDTPVHLSYPYMAKIDDGIILMPEMSESGSTTLYKLASNGTRQWLATLPVAGVDPVLFQHNGLFWLALTDRAIDTRSNLCLWYATDLSGPWTPHAGNPVKLDVRSSRNAGTPFVHGGSIYRPAQDCSQTYGGQVVINRVLECSPSAYKEEEVAVVAPHSKWTVRDGLHTLSSCGNYTLIDAKVVAWSLSGATAKIGRRLWPSATPRPTIASAAGKIRD